MYFFTSIAKNYIPKARILAKSLKKFHPDYKIGVVLCDELPKDFDLKDEPFDDLFLIEDLSLPVKNLKQWIFKHTIVELCTAVKGQMFLKLLTEKYDEKIVYLDPDMVVLSDIGELSKLLDAHNIILTPHITEPEETKDAILNNEIFASLQHGIYNLGFLAVKNNDEGVRFARWWRDRLVEYCYDDVPSGLFTDQRWIDLVPALFDGVNILKDKTYNVATWNLTHRKVVGLRDGSLGIEGKPIRIYHFSGFDSGAQEIMLKKFCRDKPLFDLREWYIDEQKKNGQHDYGKEKNAYGFYADGTEILKEHRFLYRKRDDLMQAFPEPQLNFHKWYEENITNAQFNYKMINLMNLKRFFRALCKERVGTVLKNTYRLLKNK